MRHHSETVAPSEPGSNWDLHHLLLLGLPALLFLALWSWTGWARRAPSRPSQPSSPAKAAFNEGIRAFAQGNYPLALSKFSESYQLNPVPVVLYNIAMCHRALFAYRQSIRAFRRYLRLMGQRLSAVEKQKIERLIQEMEGKLARVVLQVQPDGSDIWVDGERVGRTPLPGPVPVDPGIRRILVAKAGYRPKTMTVRLVDAQRVTLRVHLQKVVGDGWVTISTSAPGAVLHGPRDRMVRLPGSMVLAPGRHRLRVTAPGFAPVDFEVRVQAGKETRRRVVLKRREPAAPIRHRATPQKSRLEQALKRTGPGGTSRPVPLYRRAWFWAVTAGVAAILGAVAGYYGWRATHESGAVDEVIRFP